MVIHYKIPFLILLFSFFLYSFLNLGNKNILIVKLLLQGEKQSLKYMCIVCVLIIIFFNLLSISFTCQW